ncbi:MAG: EF-P lysine aminoacylase EpmA [Gammaproteobacteria bacterium]
MSHALNPDTIFLHESAKIIQNIRAFFAARHVLEVQTSLLAETGVTDPHLHSIRTSHGYLQTSPEYAMKRLLANGSGDIYQICKAFRREEVGRWHRCEFTMLEWYRVGYDHHQLMDDMDALLQSILKSCPAERVTYEDLFLTHLDIHPHDATLEQLQDEAKKHGLLDVFGKEHRNHDDWLNLLLSHCIEPKLGMNTPCFVYDYPASQAMLAKIKNNKASRFEVYYKGIELANGFHELQDAKEQRARFEENNRVRQTMNLEIIPIDEAFLAALEKGLPDCAGVALGVDRLILLALGMDGFQTIACV